MNVRIKNTITFFHFRSSHTHPSTSSTRKPVIKNASCLAMLTKSEISTFKNAKSPYHVHDVPYVSLPLTPKRPHTHTRTKKKNKMKF